LFQLNYFSNMKEIVARIEKWMSAQELTAPELAQKLQMNRSTVVHILGGRNKPSVQFIVNLAQFDPKLDVRELLTGSPSASQNNDEAKQIINDMEHQQSPRLSNKELIVLNADGTYKTFVERQ
jgi:transcriptional regulator with XRE-family HTH domain